MITLNKSEVLALHDLVIQEHGGSYGMRDEGLLESAVYMPYMTFDGADLYPTLIEKAGQLCFGLVKNHPFVDGNKRTAFAACDVFLRINDLRIEADWKRLHELVLRWLALAPNERFRAMEEELRPLIMEV